MTTAEREGASADEIALFNDISRVGADLWAKSQEVTGLSTDPKMFSIMLFKRLWSNYRGFALLWNNRLFLEADILLRSAIEAAICIGANFELRDRFIAMMRQDAAQTLVGQIQLHRSRGEADYVSEAEACRRELVAGLPPGTKPAKLDWKELARLGNQPHLYAHYRMLSGTSSHITGLSILRGVASEAGADLHRELHALTQRTHFAAMAGAALSGFTLHASMIGDGPAVARCCALTDRLEALSYGLPGVEPVPEP